MTYAVMYGRLTLVTLPSWVPAQETKPAPMPLLLVQSFVNTWDGDDGSDLLLDPAAARDWLTDAGPTISKILLATTAKVPGADKVAFDKAAQDAKANCPISRLFKNNTEITLDAKLA